MNFISGAIAINSGIVIIQLDKIIIANIQGNDITCGEFRGYTGKFKLSASTISHKNKQVKLSAGNYSNNRVLINIQIDFVHKCLITNWDDVNNSQKTMASHYNMTYRFEKNGLYIHSRDWTNFERATLACEFATRFITIMQLGLIADIWRVIFEKIADISKHSVIVGRDRNGRDYELTKKYFGDYCKYGECADCIKVVCCYSKECDLRAGNNRDHVICVAHHHDSYHPSGMVYDYVNTKGLIACVNGNCMIRGAKLHCARCFPVCRICDIIDSNCFEPCIKCLKYHCNTVVCESPDVYSFGNPKLRFVWCNMQQCPFVNVPYLLCDAHSESDIIMNF